MAKAFWGSRSERERVSAFMVEVLRLGRYNLDFSNFTIIWKGESSSEKFRVVWSTENGEEDYSDETIINVLTEIFQFYK